MAKHSQVHAGHRSRRLLSVHGEVFCICSRDFWKLLKNMFDVWYADEMPLIIHAWIGCVCLYPIARSAHIAYAISV